MKERLEHISLHTNAARITIILINAVAAAAGTQQFRRPFPLFSNLLYIRIFRLVLISDWRVTYVARLYAINDYVQTPRWICVGLYGSVYDVSHK